MAKLLFGSTSHQLEASLIWLLAILAKDTTSLKGASSSFHNYLRTSHTELVKEMEAENEKLNTNKKYRFY